MKITAPESDVYDRENVPTFEWEKYQRGFLGILNNAYNQSCNAGGAKLGTMSEISSDFADHGGGSWNEFIDFYDDEYNGKDRRREATVAMADNIIDRVESVGGEIERYEAIHWSHMYIWNMMANTYRGFCSEETAIRLVAEDLDEPYSLDGDESAGVDGYIGESSVQVKPESHSGLLDVNAYDVDVLIVYSEVEGVFEFDVRV